MIRIYHHTSQLRANSERAPLNSHSVSGHRLLCASLLVFSYLPLGRCCCCRRHVSRFVFSSAQTPLSGAAPLFSSAAALLFHCAWKRRWCVSPAAGGTKFAARTAIPLRCCGYRATVDFVGFVVDRNKQGRCFTGQIYSFYSSVLGGPSAALFTRFFYVWCAAQRRVLRAFYVLAYLLGSWGICQRLWMWKDTQVKWSSQANSAARRNGITSASRAINSRCR